MMSIIIEAGSAFDKQVLTNILRLDRCSEQHQRFEYSINQPCNCLLSSPLGTQSCCERAVRYAGAAFRMWDAGLRDAMFLSEFTSHHVVSDVCRIKDISQQTEEVEAKDPLIAQTFEEITVTESELQSAETLSSLCFPASSSTLAAAIVQYGREAVLYFKIPFEKKLLLYAVFDPHARSDCPSGPSFLISWKPINIHALEVFASAVSDIRKASICRTQSATNRTTAVLKETSNAAFNHVLDQDRLQNPASFLTSWTSKTVAPKVVVVSRCEANAPTNLLENQMADAMERKLPSDINSQNKASNDFLSGNSRGNSLYQEEWQDKKDRPTSSMSPRSHPSSLQVNDVSAWSNQSSSPSDDDDIFRIFQPPWTLRPPSPPFFQSYPSSSRSLTNFNMEDNGPNDSFSVDALQSLAESEKPSHPGTVTPYWLRTPLSKSQQDGTSMVHMDEDFRVPSLRRLSTTGHLTNTIPRSKQKQKRNDLFHSSDHFDTCLMPGTFLGKAAEEEFNPYSSVQHSSRPGSAPESDSSRAGPSRLGSLDSQWRGHSCLGRSASFQAIPANNRDNLTQRTMSQEDWEVALLQQLQQEEEIVASVAHQISSEAAWMVQLQQYLAEQKHGHGSSSSLLTSFDLDRQLALQLEQEEAKIASRTHPRLTQEASDSPVLSEPSDPTFECGVCHERCKVDVKIFVEDCGHSYCRECVGSLTRAKIEDNRYPVVCPDCLIDRSRGVKCQISLDILRSLDLSPGELERLEELQTLSHSVVLECPKCNERISINRPEYRERKFIICSSKECGYRWCKDCLKSIKNLSDRHRCKNENIERLMRRKGWKYCPGCRTPVLKESGCNHMTCSAPGCNAHFCYICGVLIVDTTNGGDVGLTVTDHYASSKCRLFDRRFYCTIQ